MDNGLVEVKGGNDGKKVINSISLDNTNAQWQSIQVGMTKIFQVHGPTKACRWLYKNSSGGFSTLAETSLNHNRSHFALANLGDRFIFAIGGSSENSCMSSAERFDIENNIWEVLPALREARQGASACVHDGSVYVVCGLANG